MLPLNHSSSALIHLEKNAEFILYCLGGFKMGELDGDQIKATCEEGGKVRVDGSETQIFYINEITCTQEQKSTAKRTDGKCARQRAQIFKIGFSVSDHTLDLVEICHNEEQAITHWVRNIQSPSFGKRQNTNNFIFEQENFLIDTNVSELYTVDSQLKTFDRILRSKDLAKYYISKSSDHLICGHLAAPEDFVYGTHQRATYNYLNCAPQWRKFNDGNWKLIETGLRNHASAKNWTVQIWTGTHGVLQLKDPKNVFRRIYLDNVSSRIVVPKIFYKIIIERNLKQGIVFIGVNNPYVSEDEILEDYTYCQDVSHLVKYITTWDRQNIAKGYSYACKVTDFLRNIPEKPDIGHQPIDSLLL